MALSGLGDWSFWEHVGKVAPIITALIALVAAVVAIISLRTQVHIARRRAAIDVFLKTEMDQAMCHINMPRVPEEAGSRRRQP